MLEIFRKKMALVVYRYGISILYKCYNIKLWYGKCCKDNGTNKCMHCKYGKAELTAEDATRLLNGFGQGFMENAKEKK